MTHAKYINPAIFLPLKEALSLAFWYKKDLRAFLSTVLPDFGLISQLDWTDYKRNVVHRLVDTMASNQSKYQDELLDLILATSEITDPSHLKRVEDGENKYDAAVQALDTLRQQIAPFKKLRTEADEALRHQREAEAKAQVQKAVREKLVELRDVLYVLIREPDHQKRGYALESLLNQLFALYDIDAKSPFKIIGEQIDGAFTFDGTEFLFEARWRQEKTSVADLDVFSGKIRRKLENTLGLFLSINGFQQSAIDTYSQHRPILFLMDGGDISAVLEDRFPLPELLIRKKQHASRKGEVFISAYELLA
ncbi:MAG TPA: hypothetical protein VGS28_01135 [Candidatus Saccharimonadales bacterium]|nr:hypothetical protein [Candidatus Saccharimonadales bacterium]